MRASGHENPIVYLNALESNGDPWPHDDAYALSELNGFYLRIHRLRGRKDHLSRDEQEGKLLAQSAALKACKEELASVKAESAATKANLERELETVKSATDLRISALESRVSSQRALHESLLARLSALELVGQKPSKASTPRTPGDSLTESDGPY